MDQPPFQEANLLQPQMASQTLEARTVLVSTTQIRALLNSN